MIDAPTIAILDLLHHGYHPPAPHHPDRDRYMVEWAERYRRRLESAQSMLAAVAPIEQEAPTCSPWK